MSDRRETYLGDGVYAAFDGYHIWLRTARDHGDNLVALEPPVWAALKEYVKRLKAEPAKSPTGGKP